MIALFALSPPKEGHAPTVSVGEPFRSAVLFSGAGFLCTRPEQES